MAYILSKPQCVKTRLDAICYYGANFTDILTHKSNSIIKLFLPDDTKTIDRQF